MAGRANRPGRRGAGTGVDRFALRAQGYYSATTKLNEITEADGKLLVIFDISEGNRVAISQVDVSRATRNSPTSELVHHMSTKPEGFFWWQKGAYDDEKVERDLRERLPRLVWPSRLHRLSGDRVIPSRWTRPRGKATLHLDVDEGQRYKVGTSRDRRQSAVFFRGAAPVLSLQRRSAAGSGRSSTSVDWEAATEKHPGPLRQQRLHLRPGRSRGDPGVPGATARHTSI